MKRIIAFLFIAVFAAAPAFAGGGAEAAAAEETIAFTMMNYGDFAAQDRLLRDLTSEFREETGIRVEYEIINWAQAREQITTWHLGGDAPDVSDMFWSYTFSDLGGGEYGTMPLNDLMDEYIPDLEERWIGASLGDVRYRGNLYGIPWRIDVRGVWYRSDFLEEAGLDPDGLNTWDDLVEYGKALTERDAAGNVTRWGVGISDDHVQAFYPFLWQAGGSFLDETFTRATIDTPEGREALQFVVDLVNEHEVMSIDNFIDPSYDDEAEFAGGRTAINPSITGYKSFVENNAPHLTDVWKGRAPLMNRERLGFQGAGYFGLNYQSDKHEAGMQWLAFLARNENMLRLAQTLGQLPPVVPVLEDPYFSEDWAFSGQIEALPYGRTSQHPHPAWGAITNNQPGAPLYDMIADAVSGSISVAEATARAQREMQQLLDETDMEDF